MISFHHSKYLYECGSSIFIQEHLPSVGSYPLKRISVCVSTQPPELDYMKLDFQSFNVQHVPSN